MSDFDWKRSWPVSFVCAARFGYFVLRARQKSVAGHEYARPNTGASITRGNSGNGALPTHGLEQSENKGHPANNPAALEFANYFRLIFVDHHTVDHTGFARAVIIHMNASARFD
jgi:hypothetical protein